MHVQPVCACAHVEKNMHTNKLTSYTVKLTKTSNIIHTNTHQDMENVKQHTENELLYTYIEKAYVPSCTAKLAKNEQDMEIPKQI
jgi:hypothetical protein